jgi:hypothetical protein
MLADQMGDKLSLGAAAFSMLLADAMNSWLLLAFYGACVANFGGRAGGGARAAISSRSDRQQFPAVCVGHLNDQEEALMNDIDQLIATAATVAVLATTLLAAHPEMFILVPS